MKPQKVAVTTVAFEGRPVFGVSAFYGIGNVALVLVGLHLGVADGNLIDGFAVLGEGVRGA